MVSRRKRKLKESKIKQRLKNNDSSLSHNSKRRKILQFPFVVSTLKFELSQFLSRVERFPTTLVARGIQTLARKSSTSDDRSSFLPARFFEYEANLEALPFEDMLKGVREKSAGHLFLWRGEKRGKLFPDIYNRPRATPR